MPILLTFEEILKLKSRDLIPCKCDYCDKITYQRKNILYRGSYEDLNAEASIFSPKRFCSQTCHGKHSDTRCIVNCKQCNKEFIRATSQMSRNNYCSSSCAALYNNAHKTKGCRRSKLEIWLDSELTKLYPNIEFHFNRKDAINSELDIYIPSLKLAFELNGIFHYEPIFGEKKLNEVKNNDKRKFQACLENNIELCIIDSSKLKYFKPEKVKQYLDIIINIINNKMAPALGTAPS